MAFFNGWPWTQFQEQNLDWIIKRLKELENLPQQFQDLTDYVHDYLDNLDIEQDVKDYIDEMYSDGRLQTLIETIVDNRVDTYWDPITTQLRSDLDAGRQILKDRIRRTGRMIIAHAGNAGDAPQNSKIGIALACGYAYDGVEIDTQISADGVPIVAHNDNLATFTDKSGLISEQNYSDFSSAVLTVGPYNSDYTVTELTIPTLVDALHIVERHTDVTPFIDIKDSYTTAAQMDAILKAADACGMRYKTIYLCDTRAKATLLLGVDPNVAVMTVVNAIGGNDITFAVNNGLIGIDCNIGGLTRTAADNAKKAGLIVGAWTFSDATISSFNTYMQTIPDMLTVSFPGYFANGNNYDKSAYNSFVSIGSYRNYAGITAINKFDEMRILGRAFTWHTTAGTYYPANANYSLLNRAMLPVKIKATQGDIIKLTAPTGYEFSIEEYRSSGMRIANSGWITGDYTISSTTCAYVIILARKSDDSNLDIKDLDLLTQKVPG